MTRLTEAELDFAISDRMPLPEPRNDREAHVQLSEMPGRTYPIRRAIHGPFYPRKPTWRQRISEWLRRLF
jgi:hypothetical protein